MILGIEQFEFAIRLITLVVPVAIYFLILGLVNSRRHPQLLSGRQDFAILLVALAPLFVLPALSYLPLWTVVLAVAAVGAALTAFSGPTRSWVIYNLSNDRARYALASCLDSMGLAFTETGRELRLKDTDAVFTVSEFPLLRNVTIRLRGGSPELARSFEAAMGQYMSRTPAQTSPMAVSLLLVATGMLVAPVTLFAQHMPQIVRAISDLIP